MEEGCGRRDGLEWDHKKPLAHRGPTAYRNLEPRCRPHHREKTEREAKPT
ncbi:MAG: HNH endonuclease signature motif containing protein [Nitriliruptorales bacterium]